MKRIFDLVVASLLFVVMLPVALGIVLVLAVTGDREIIYGQWRVGRGGREFRMLKFVTMRKGSRNMGAGPLTLPDDPRVLPFGRFLRKTKLNELPQLLNVIKGDMSLVGPRPQPADIFQYYSPAARARIVEVRPGITGVGSVLFRDEERLLQESPLPPQECHRDVFAPIKEELETWYVDHQGVWLDFELVLLTGLAVVAPRSRLYQFGLKHLGLPPRLIAAPRLARRPADEVDDELTGGPAVRRSPVATAPSARRATQKQ